MSRSWIASLSAIFLFPLAAAAGDLQHDAAAVFQPIDVFPRRGASEKQRGHARQGRIGPQAVFRAASFEEPAAQLRDLPQSEHRRRRRRPDLRRSRLAKRPAPRADRVERRIQRRAVLGRPRRGSQGAGQGTGAGERRDEQHAGRRRGDAAQHSRLCRRIPKGFPERSDAGVLRQHGEVDRGLRDDADYAERRASTIFSKATPARSATWRRRACGSLSTRAAPAVTAA